MAAGFFTRIGIASNGLVEGNVVVDFVRVATSHVLQMEELEEQRKAQTALTPDSMRILETSELSECHTGSTLPGFLRSAKDGPTTAVLGNSTIANWQLDACTVSMFRDSSTYWPLNMLLSVSDVFDS